jgi:hypothetical protein
LIKKNIDNFRAKDKFSQAGLNAERQMAFYLKREFEDSSKIYVLNSLRLYRNDDSAQIDHLIIHKFGMIIIESKSVIGKVIINRFGEWSRYFDGLKGMPSPLKQGERQASFLVRFLNESGPLLPNTLGLPRTYDKMPIDILVAISDSAIIQRQSGSEVENVCKADMIPDKVNEIVQRYDKEKGLLSLAILNITLSNEIIDQIGKFLIKSHTPLVDDRESYSPEIKEFPIKQPQREPKVSDNSHGFCIHCRREINLEPKIPYCKSCYNAWKIQADKDHFEPFCHVCGQTNKSTINKPCCPRCYQISKNTLEYFKVKKLIAGTR